MKTCNAPAASRSLGLCVALVGLFWSQGVFASDFYVDPALGSADGAGSAADPWQTLEEVAESGKLGAAVQGGDTVWLRSGYHGSPRLRGRAHTSVISIAREAGAEPQVSSLVFSDTTAWAVSGLTISPTFGNASLAADMVSVDQASSEIVLSDNVLFSVADASAWTAQDWLETAVNGFQISGEQVTLRKNQLRNVRFGISVSGANNRVEHNQVINFSGDALRGLGNYGVFEYNLVKNAYVSEADGDANHDDGFQSWSTGPAGPGDGEVLGIVLRGNTFINSEDPAQPLQNALQAIGCFDGFFVDWVIENNVVITDHWHGITLLGARDSRIVNNTVIDLNAVSPGPPWIMIGPHKDARPSENVIVRNNLATDFSLEGTGIVDDHNTTLTDLGAFFVDPATFDLHLLPGSAAVDTGSQELAPALDRDGIKRPQGVAVDQGAYEYHEAGGVGGAVGGAGGSEAGMGGADGGSSGAGGTDSGGTAGSDSGGTAGTGGSAGAGGSSDSGGSGAAGGVAGSNAGAGGTSPAGGGETENGCSCELPGAGFRGAWAETWPALLLALCSLRFVRRAAR